MLTARVDAYSCVAQLHLITLITNTIGAHLRDSPNVLNLFTGVRRLYYRERAKMRTREYARIFGARAVRHVR